MKRIIIFAVLPLLCVSCFPTRIVTYTPTETASYYTTTVTPPRSNTTTLVTQVNAKNPDISLHLDLQAVGALFAQSSSPQEFEQLLNSSSYPVSNLDLNGDGYIDYLRVLETVNGFNHVYLIQALLSPDVYQDVATIVVERPAYNDYCVEIVGAPYIYGPSYIVRPTFILRPVIFKHICRVGYNPWRSPWYWNHFPSYYRHPVPVYLNHYQSYIHTFMGGHRYCNRVTYPAAPHYPGFSEMTREFARNDYGTKYPERSFTVRNANVPRSETGAGMVRNAYDIQRNADATKITTTSVTGRGATQNSVVRGSTAATPSANAQSSASSTTRSATTNSTTRSATASTTTRSTATPSTSSSTRSASSSTATRSSSSTSSTRSTGTVSSSVRSSGSSTTTRSSSATSPRTSSASSSSRSSSSSSTRSSSSSSSSRSSSASSSTRSSSGSATRSGSSTSRGSR